MSKRLNRGFTLIELLVVIAIIGILSTVVLASLNTTRDKAQDANIQATLRGVLASAAIEYDDLGNSYNKGTAINSIACENETAATSIFGDASIQNAMDEVKRQSPGNVVCIVEDTDYAIAVLKVQDTAQDGDGDGNDHPDYWCVDGDSVAIVIDISSEAAITGGDNTCAAMDAR